MGGPFLVFDAVRRSLYPDSEHTFDLNLSPQEDTKWN